MAAALAAGEKLYNCAECRKAGLDKSRYCADDAPYPIYEINGEEFTRCPVQFVTGASLEALSAYRFYNNGYLPCQGGYLDQPNLIMGQMDIISDQIHEERKNKRGK